MKKWIVAILGLVMMTLPLMALAEEFQQPQANNKGVIGGRHNEAWRLGIFGTLLLPEISTPTGDPPANFGWLYVKDSGGASTLYFENDAGVATPVGGTPTWDAVGDPAANASISLGTFTNTFTGAATAAHQNQFINTGNMGDYGIVLIQQMTGTPTDGKLLYGTMSAAILDGIQIYSSNANPSDVTLLRLDFNADDDVQGYYIICRDNNSADTEFSVGPNGAVIAGAITAPSITSSAGLSLVSAASSAITLNADSGNAAGEDLIITAHNIQLTAAGAMTLSPDGAVTTAIDASNANYTNALSVGARHIIGTTGQINYTAFDVNVTGAGNVEMTGNCAVGGNLTVTGTASLGALAQDSLVPASVAPHTIKLNAAGAGGILIGDTSTGTITLGGSATLVDLPANTDMTLSGGTLGITDSANSNILTLTNASMTTASAIAITTNAVTSGKVISVTADGLNTGTMLYLDSDAIPANTYYIYCFDGTNPDFTVMADGVTTIAGAAGAAALILGAGDFRMDNGLLDIDTTTATYLSHIKMTTNTDVAADAALLTLEDTDTNAANAHYLLRLRHAANLDAEDHFLVMEDNAGDDKVAFNSGGTTVWSLDPANYVQIDAATVANTTTTGALDINFQTVTTGGHAQNIYLNSTGAGGNVYGLKIDLDDDTSAAGTLVGLYIDASDAAGHANTVNYGIYSGTSLDVGYWFDLGVAADGIKYDVAANFTGQGIIVDAGTWLGTAGEGFFEFQSDNAVTAEAGQVIRINLRGTAADAAAISGKGIYVKDTAGATAGSYLAHFESTNNGAAFFSGPGGIDMSAAPLQGASPIVLEGATANGFEVTLAVTDPESDTTITIPDGPASSDMPVVLAAGGTTTTQAAAGTSTVTGSSIAVPAAHAAAGQMYQWLVGGTKTGANAAMIVHCNLYGNQVMSLSGSDAAAVDWIARFTVYVIATNSQRIIGELLCNGKVAVTDYAIAAIDISGAGNVYLQIQSQAAGDTVTSDVTQVKYNQ